MSNHRARIDWDAARRRLQEAETALERALVADAEKIDRVYRDRALRMAERHSEAAANVCTIRVLVFSLGAETYGIPIADLAEVLPSMKCSPVPRAAAEITGVINLRGELRSVIDLQRLLALPGAGDDSSSRILMLRKGDGEVGLKVGQVEKVQSIQEGELASLEARGADAPGNYFKGLSPDGIIVIDTSALLSHRVFKISTR